MLTLVGMVLMVVGFLIFSHYWQKLEAEVADRFRPYVQCAGVLLMLLGIAYCLVVLL